jgi:hypothetical protein
MVEQFFVENARQRHVGGRFVASVGGSTGRSFSTRSVPPDILN